MQINHHLKGVLLHHVRKLLQLCRVRNLPLAIGPNLVVKNLGLRITNCRARIPNRRENTPPIRVPPKPTRLRKGRLRDRPCRPCRILLIPRPTHRHRHKLRRAFPIRRHLLGKRNAHRLQRPTKRLKRRTATRNLRIPSLPRRHHKHRIIRRFIPVHHQPIETLRNRKPQRTLQHRPTNRRVRRNKSQHRRHIRLNHPGPLAHAAHRHALAINHHHRARFLRLRVRRHHSLFCREPMRRRPPQIRRGTFHPRHQSVHRQPPPNDARRRHQNMLRRNPQFGRGRLRRRLRIL